MKTTVLIVVTKIVGLSFYMLQLKDTNMCSFQTTFLYMAENLLLVIFS